MNPESVSLLACVLGRPLTPLDWPAGRPLLTGRQKQEARDHQIDLALSLKRAEAWRKLYEEPDGPPTL